jgi:predicted metalloprotease
MGPFYCPADQKVYIDLGFYHELRRRFGAPGDFAQAYVLAHEVGHHVQGLLGLETQLRSAQERNPGQANALSVRFELQADCLAGVWAHSTQQRDILEAGDVEEALGAAAAVGDDRIQKQSSGGVNPETWTHGSASQRMEWFNTGLQNGRIQSCDTFSSRAAG